jgi:hypothetical protein
MDYAVLTTLIPSRHLAVGGITFAGSHTYVLNHPKMAALQDSRQMALHIASLPETEREEKLREFDYLTPDQVQEIRTMAYFMEIGFAFSEQA